MTDDALAFALGRRRSPGELGGVIPVLKAASAWYDAQDVNSVIANGALTFLASDNQFLQIDIAPVFAYPMTLACRVKTTAVAEGGLVWVGDKDDVSEFQRLSILASGVVEASSASSFNGRLFVRGAVVNDGVYHHVVSVYSGPTSRKIYVDSDSPLESTNLVTIGATYDRVTIGFFGDSAPTSPFDGDIAVPTIWNLALTDAQVAAFIGGTAPGEGIVPSAISLWPLNDPSAPYVDIVGELDLAAFGDVGEPTPTLGPEDIQATEGAAVSQWTDSSDNTNDVIQATPVLRPEYVKVPWVDGFRRAIRGDGVDDFLRATFAYTQPFSVWALFRYASPASNLNEYIWTQDSSNSPRALKNTANLILFNAGSTLTGTVATGGYELFRFHAEGISSDLERNGVVDVAGSGGTANGTGLTQFANSTGLSPSDGDLLELLIDDASSPAEIEAYFRKKYVLNWGDIVFSGPSIWLSASSIDITTADDGSGGDVTNGQAIGFWPGISGNNNNAIQAITIDKPIFDSSNAGYGNQSVVAFDGTQLLSADALASLLSGTDQPATYFIVFDADVNAQDRVIFESSTAGIDPRIELARLTADGKLSFTKDDGVTPATLLTDSDWGNAPALLVIKDTGTVITFLKDGTAIGTGAVDTGALTAMDLFTLGSKGGASGSLVGSLAQLMIWPDRLLSDTEINAVANPMAAQYGLPTTWNL